MPATPKFVTTPETEILGQAILAVTTSINYDDYKPFFEAGLTKYDYDVNIDPEKWYSLQMLLDIYKSMYDAPNAQSNLVSIGVKVIEASPFPPEIDSIEKAVHALNVVYETYVRNYQPGHEYTVEAVSETQIKIIDHQPFPHDLIYGYMFAVGKRFAPQGKHAIIHRTYLNEDDPDADGAIYIFNIK